MVVKLERRKYFCAISATSLLLNLGGSTAREEHAVFR
jgi:hypothetical protein